MGVLPRLLIAFFIVSVMSGTAMLRAAPPEGMPRSGRHMEAAQSRRHECKHGNRDHRPRRWRDLDLRLRYGSRARRRQHAGLPILGKGPVRNVVDILNLKTIDMGMVVSDVPEFYRLQYKIRISPRSCDTSRSFTTTKSMSSRRPLSNRSSTWRESGSWPRRT